MQPYKAWLIQDLVEKNRRIFKIPVYQRNYDWNSVQCEKLFEDIMMSFDEDKKHFMGSVVYIKGNNSSSRLDEAMVIDGQQRITTIFILLKVLYDLANERHEEGLASEISDYLYNRNCDEKYKLKLKPVKNDNVQFNKMMVDSEDEVDENSNIICNYRLFRKLIELKLNSNYLLSDILEGMKKLEIVEIVLDLSQGDDPQTIFESINSTGLELSLADLIRNYLLMSDDNQEYLFENYWSYMERVIGSGKGLADFFIHYLNLKISDQVTEKNAYAKFKKYCGNQNHEELMKDMKRYSKYYGAFIGRENDYGKGINLYLRDFRLLDQSTIYPFLFCMFSDYEDGKIDNKIVEKILKYLRSYLLRRIVCGVPSNSLKGLFKTLHGRLYKDGTDNYYERFYLFFASLRTKDKFTSDKEFFDGLVYGELYRKSKCCKYLLATIENENCNEKLDTSNMTIEHIFPQKENSLVWKNEIGEKKYEAVYSKYLHTLGNLTITGYNSELGTKPFAEKKRIIREFSKANKLNESILSAETWNEKSIVNRAKQLANYLVSIFHIDETEVVFDETKEEIGRMTLSDGESVPNTKPVSFTFLGETVSVKSYASMLMSISNLLYDLDDKILLEMAKNKFKMSTDRIFISMREDDLRRPNELGNSGIFIETKISSSDILRLIQRIIEKYEFDPDEFEFYVDHAKPGLDQITLNDILQNNQ